MATTKKATSRQSKARRPKSAGTRASSGEGSGSKICGPLPSPEFAALGRQRIHELVAQWNADGMPRAEQAAIMRNYRGGAI